MEGRRLLVEGMLDGSAVQVFVENLRRGNVQTVVFVDSMGGTAEAAGLYAQAIRETGVNTEVIGQCHAACAYAYLAGKVHRFGEGEQVNALLIPVGTRPKPAELASRWRGEESYRTLAEFTEPPQDGEMVDATDAPPKEKWRPEHGVLFVASPTLFGRVYNTYYCDGSQGRDFTRCELLADADPRKLGVISD
ncbi:hypothetical protein [Variovorax sp. OV329]|uniref:hypothetical protein n=1 Tax=Variovorax sp. OV329 TaxID=1882825 RepID=UPI000B89E781|nr:hypothetical protein [Variovorax sp. OV329]